MTRTLIVTLLLLAAPAGAQDKAPSDLDRYRAQSLEFRIEPGWGGGIQLYKGGVQMDPGFFGQDAEHVFGDSQEAMEKMEAYTTMRISGMALYATGLSALLVELVLLVVAPETIVDEGAGNQVKPLFWGLLAGGTVVSAAGGVLLGVSQYHLSDAVRHYNDDLYQRLKNPGQTSGFGLTLRTGF